MRWMIVRALLLLGAVAALIGCDRKRARSDRVSDPTAASAAASNRAAAEGSVSQAAPSVGSVVAARPPLAPETFGRLVEQLSEPDAHFFSTNYVSNETSYLQVADQLQRTARPGGAYLGVGPEQNFTYIALTRPSLAFIIDIRRQNALLHLLYKAAFDTATSRSHFVALLLGRPYRPSGAPGPMASVAQVLEHAQTSQPDRDHFRQVHTQLVERIEQRYRVRLSQRDRAELRLTHGAFFDHQLEIKFELPQSGRRYPPLAKLLAAHTATGQQRGFLATESAFRYVQRLQREHRIIPIVGDFAGEQALRGVARELVAHQLKVAVFYVSNVEQYLLQAGKWQAWTRNVAALPTHEASLFVRCYLDQGRRHPLQLQGYRTTTLLQSIARFRQRQRDYRSFWQLANDSLL